MYTKEDVLKISEEHFLTRGYDIQDNEGLKVIKDGISYPVIALGTVNDLSSTSMRGKGFNKNQVKSLLGLCLFEIISVNNPCKLILPDTKIYRKQFACIKEGLKKLQVEVYYVAEGGTITFVEK